MTIRRQYSLPNCTLVLEGLSSTVADPATQTGRPPLNVLMRFECHLIGQETPLIGGRALLENLAAAASQCAQEVLSGIHRGDRFALDGRSSLIQLKNVDTLFRLVVPSELLVDVIPFNGEVNAPEHSSSQKAPPVGMDLSIVQVFDLVEAFDQLLADTQTLPDLSLKFSSLPKREAASGQSIAKQAAPVALGVTSLGVAGVALFFIPVPEVRKPQSPPPQETPSRTNSGQPTGPLIPTRSPEQPVNPDQRSSLAAPLASAPMITDRQQLAELSQKLYTQIAQAWKTKPFHQDLIYRVSVDQNGKIVGYRPMNQAAIDYRQEVPLLDLLEAPVSVSAASQPELVTQQLLAQFQVVFTSDSVLQVRPWGGYRKEGA